MKVILTLFVLVASGAQGLTIFDVRKNLPMSDNEKVYRDFYINGGSESGLQRGMIITVERRMPLYDTYASRSAGDLQLKVAKVKIIHVQKGLAVARIFSEFTREDAPMLEDPFIMVGDRLDLNSATSEKESKKAEAAPTEEQQTEPVAAAQVNPTPQIVVNSVELSSESLPNPNLPQQVTAPVLQ